MLKHTILFCVAYEYASVINQPVVRITGLFCPHWENKAMPVAAESNQRTAKSHKGPYQWLLRTLCPFVSKKY